MNVSKCLINNVVNLKGEKMNRPFVLMVFFFIK